MMDVVLYDTGEEKAANLLYFIVKNHAFTDGNKRIGAALFITFLAANGALYRADGSKRLADNALMALDAAHRRKPAERERNHRQGNRQPDQPL